jgi:beta-phosphoglucomutase-like phosphatase (HAD superfamily)
VKTLSKIGVSARVYAETANALVLEMDQLVGERRKFEFDTLKSALDKKDVTLTPALFARHCLHRRPAAYVPAVLHALGKEKLSAAKMAEEIESQLNAACLAAGAKLAPALRTLLQRAKEKGLKIGGVSAFDRATAESLAAGLEPVAGKVSVFSIAASPQTTPAADAWLRLARAMGIPSSRCVALTTSSLSCRSAVKARMKCVAIPDRLTGCEDFGGADLFAGSLADVDPAAVFSLLEGV